MKIILKYEKYSFDRKDSVKLMKRQHSMYRYKEYEMDMRLMY